MEQNLIYYVDQYLDGQFLSRSEPCFDRESCEELFFKLNEGSGYNVFFKMNVSMPLEDYENLVLSSQKIRIRYIDREPTPARPDSPTPVPSIEDELGPEPNYNFLEGDYNLYEPSLDYEGEYDLESECEPASVICPPTRKAYKTKGGYVVYNNKRIENYSNLFGMILSQQIPRNYVCKKSKINDYDLNFLIISGM